MLKKKLGIEVIERNWGWGKNLTNHFKIPSTLIIPEGCARVGRGVLEGCDWLKKVVISEGVLWIRGYAFWKCKKLEEVIISESVEKIGYEAFRECKNATIILKKKEEDFEKIGSYAFWKCKDVKEEIRA